MKLEHIEILKHQVGIIEMMKDEFNPMLTNHVSLYEDDDYILLLNLLKFGSLERYMHYLIKNNVKTVVDSLLSEAIHKKITLEMVVYYYYSNGYDKFNYDAYILWSKYNKHPIFFESLFTTIEHSDLVYTEVPFYNVDLAVMIVKQLMPLAGYMYTGARIDGELNEEEYVWFKTMKEALIYGLCSDKSMVDAILKLLN